MLLSMQHALQDYMTNLRTQQYVKYVQLSVLQIATILHQ